MCIVFQICVYPLFSFGHCAVCPSPIYGFWLPPFGILKFFLLLSRILLIIQTTEINPNEMFMEHLRSPSALSEVRVTRSLVLCVMFYRSLFVFLSFSFVHCVVCPSIYGFWLPPFVSSNLSYYLLSQASPNWTR